MNEALLVTIISKIRQIFVVFLCLTRGSVSHTGCFRTVLLYFLRHFIHREARSIVQSLFPYAKEGGIGFRRGLASIQ